MGPQRVGHDWVTSLWLWRRRNLQHHMNIAKNAFLNVQFKHYYRYFHDKLSNRQILYFYQINKNAEKLAPCFCFSNVGEQLAWVWNTLDIYFCFYTYMEFSKLCPKSCPTLCNLLNCNIPSFPVLYYLLEFAQTHVHRISDVIQLSHLLSSLSPPAFNLFQH